MGNFDEQTWGISASAISWTNGGSGAYGLTVRADSSTDDYSWKKYSTQEDTYGFIPDDLQVTWTPYFATYSVPSETWATPLTPTQNGVFKVTATNYSNVAWPAGGQYRMSYQVWKNGSLYSSGTLNTAPTTTVPIHGSYTFPVSVAALPAGLNGTPQDYTIDFDMEHVNSNGTHDFWFSDYGDTVLGRGVTVTQPPAGITAMTPLSGATVYTTTPPLAITASGGGTITYNYELCTDAAFTQNCTTTGFISSSSWTPPPNLLAWNGTYYWRGEVSNGTGSPTWSGGLTLYTAVPQPTTSAALRATTPIRRWSAASTRSTAT